MTGWWRWLFVAGGVACMLVSYVSYAWLAWRRVIAPDKAAYLVWAVLLVVATKSGLDLSSWSAVVVMAVGTAGVVAVCVCAWTRSGVWIRSRLTWWLLLLGLSAAVVSMFAARVSIVLVLFASLAALSLEVRKTWLMPYTESLGPWLVSAVGEVFAVLVAADSGWWPVATPLLFAVINAVMCAVIVWSPHRHPTDEMTVEGSGTASAIV